ncbi:Sulfotransferase [Gracilaria domingensis]|nr:Sulfotransferase [Gracilaria domingensis]
MTCVAECKERGCFYFLRNTPHADMLELELAFADAGIMVDEVGFMTLLRDPIERYMSEYRHITKAAPNNCSSNINRFRFGWDFNYSCDLDFRTFASDAEHISINNNRQTKMIAGLGEFGVQELYGSYSNMLKIAKLNLDRLFWLGSKHSFNRSIGILKKRLDNYRNDIKLGEISTLSTRNTLKYENLSKALHMLSKENNYLDVLLYDYAKRSSVLLDENIIPTREMEIRGQKKAPALFLRKPSNSVSSLKTVVKLGEVFDSSVIKKYPDCEFPQTDHSLVGTWTWYDSKFGCALNYSWYKLTTFEIPKYNIKFSTRSFLSDRKKNITNFILLIGAAQTMGIQAKKPYAYYLHMLSSMPVIIVGWGGIGPGFYSDILKQKLALSKVLRYLVQNAKYIVIQAMSGRSAASSICPQKCWNMYCQNGSVVQHLVDRMGESGKQVIKKDWMAAHYKLIVDINRLKEKRSHIIFHYISTSLLAHRDEHEFPQFIDRNLFRNLVEHVRKKNIPIESVVSVAEKRSKDDFQLRPMQCILGNKHYITPGCAVNRSLVCNMHNLVNNCNCHTFRVHYYPSYRLHRLSGVQLAHKIRILEQHL